MQSSSSSGLQTPFPHSSKETPGNPREPEGAGGIARLGLGEGAGKGVEEEGEGAAAPP